MTISTITIWLASLWINGLQAPLLQHLLQLSVQLQSLRRSLQIYDAQGSLFSRSEYSNSQGYRRETELSTTKFSDVLRGNGETSQTPSKLDRSLRVQESAPNSQKLMEINSYCGLIDIKIRSLLKNWFPRTTCVNNELFDRYPPVAHPCKKIIEKKNLLNMLTIAEHEQVDASIQEKQTGAVGLKDSCLYCAVSIVAMLVMDCTIVRGNEGGLKQKASCRLDPITNMNHGANYQTNHSRSLSLAGTLHLQQKIIDLIIFRQSLEKFLEKLIRTAANVRNCGNCSISQIQCCFCELERPYSDPKTSRSYQLWRLLDDFQDRRCLTRVSLAIKIAKDLTNGVFLVFKSKNSTELHYEEIQIHQCQGSRSISSSEIVFPLHRKSIKAMKDSAAFKATISKWRRYHLHRGHGDKQAILIKFCLPKYQIRYGMNASVEY